MIGYVTMGTNNLEKSVKFYDALFGEMGVSRILETEQFIAWGRSMGEPGISINKPHDGKPATVGNGNMVAIMLESTDDVDKMYKKAIELGGTDEGAAGPRGEGGFYAGYFRDLDGNKLNFFYMPH